MLKHYALAIREAHQLDVNITEDELKEWCKDNLNTYWANWIEKSKTKVVNSIYTLSMRAVTWGVLGIVRLYATIESGDIISKSEAGLYALTKFDPKWHYIIVDALNWRANNHKTHYYNPFKRRKIALEFMEHILEEALKL